MPKTNKVLLVVLVAAALSVSSTLAAGLEERVSEMTLSNGMRWFFVERHTSPTFSGVIQFKVGGVDEQPGLTGLAHLFEHMAFKGTTLIGTSDYEAEKVILDEIEGVADKLTQEQAKESPDADIVAALSQRLAALRAEHKKYVVKDEFFRIYERNGAVGLNAGTGKDTTTYYVSLPSNRLELYCLMEAQRIADPVFREFYTERDVVLEERRTGIDTNPRGKLYEQFMATAFNAHPYRWPIHGWAPEIGQVTARQARELYRTYYVPSNGVGVLVGDFDTELAKRLVEEYFGRIPPGRNPVVEIPEEPVQVQERRVEVEFDAEPDLLIGYHVPTYPDSDFVAIQVVSSLLSVGRSSRLYKKLVKELEFVTSVGTYTVPGLRYPNVFVIDPIPRTPHTTSEIEEAIYEELERLKAEPVSERELRKVKNQVDASMLWGLSTNLGMAYRIALYEQIYGDWRYYYEFKERLDEVTLADISRVARKYFTEENRTVVILRKPKEDE